MELTGKIIEILPLQEGKGQKGPWKKQTYVMEYPSPTNSQYNLRFAFVVWNDRIDSFNLYKGKCYKVTFDVDAREWQGRWYNDFTAWQAEEVKEDDVFVVQPAVEVPATSGNANPQGGAANNSGFGSFQTGTTVLPADDNGDDLPF